MDLREFREDIRLYALRTGSADVDELTEILYEFLDSLDFNDLRLWFHADFESLLSEVKEKAYGAGYDDGFFDGRKQQSE